MGRKSITNILLEKYQKNLYETSKKITLDETNTLHGYESYFYEDLPKTNVKGYPVGSDFFYEGNSYSMLEHEKLPKEIQEKCKLRYHYLPLCHEFYLGTTGSGKTTGCVEPQLRAIAYQKNKPNIFITDPKGEIYEKTFFGIYCYSSFVRALLVQRGKGGKRHDRRQHRHTDRRVRAREHVYVKRRRNGSEL